MRESSKNEIDRDVQVKDWRHPADTVRITEHPEDEEIQIYTGGRENDNGVGAGRAIFIKGKLQSYTCIPNIIALNCTILRLA